MDFLISHHKVDFSWAEWIAWQLKEVGHTTVLQEWDPRGGGKFVDEVQRAATGAKRILAVLSPDYLAEGNTQSEWNAVYAQDPTWEKGMLLLVRVRPCRPEGLLPDICYIDLVSKDEERARADLLAGVQLERAKPVPPSVPISPKPRPPGPLPIPAGRQASAAVKREPIPASRTLPLPVDKKTPAGLIGRTLGKYKVERELGRGGMGQVYLAKQLDIGGRVAIKVLHRDLSRDPQVAQRFYNEARAVNQVEHPGLVKVLDYGQLEEGAAYLVMEYLNGESLAARLRRESAGMRKGQTVLRLGWEMASILDAVHKKGIVHRDLKPDNIMLVPDSAAPAGGERVKILDFGIAKVASEHSQALTRTGMMLGTPAYMAPEQCTEANKVSDRADVYSLGVILYQLLCGRPPFVAQDVMKLLYKQVHEKARPIREHAPMVYKDLAALVHRMLEKDPGKRPSMANVAGELRDMLAVKQVNVASRLVPLLLAFSGLLIGGIFALLMLVLRLYGCGQQVASKPGVDGRSPLDGDVVLSEMVEIPAGKFMMGSKYGAKNGEKDEVPEHLVTFKNSFYMDRTEVTVAAYYECVKAGPCLDPKKEDNLADRGCMDLMETNYFLGKNDHPITCIKHPRARAYCEWRHKRLPTEEEWEYAARGPIESEGQYPWGNNEEPWNQPCWKTRGTCPVDGHKEDRSPFGVYGMAGNVSEWTSSPYSVYRLDSDRSHINSMSWAYRVVRGGSWNSSTADQVRAARRVYFKPDEQSNDLGFRCARGM